MNRYKRQLYSKDRGMALLTALLVVAIATIAAVAMATRQQVDIRKTENLLRMEQAWQFAHGIDSWAMGRLAEDRKKNQTDSHQDGWNSAIAPTEIEGGALTANIVDLQGRLNLNNVLKDGKPSEPDLVRFRRLLANLGHPPGLADALLDWVDPDSDVRYLNGAEDSVYLERKPPYRSANQPLADVSELLLIEGFDREIYNDLRDHVTVLSGYTTINVNTATLVVLQGLADEVSAEDAAALIEARDASPFTEISAFLEHPALAGRELKADGLGLASDHFIINGDVQIGRMRLEYASTVYRPKEGDLRVIKRMRKGVFDG